MEENNPQQAPQAEQESRTAAEIEKEIEAASKPKKPKSELAGVRNWLMFLSIVFTISMLSGFYIIFYGPAPKKQAVVEAGEEGEGGGAAAALLKLSSKEEGITLVRIRGLIQEGNESGWGTRPGASVTAKRIRALAERKEVKGMLLDINSPGGTVAAVQDIYEALLYFKSKGKPVVALMRDTAASGGFYVAMPADKIVAQPGTITGSIGVIMQASNFEGLFDKIGIKFVPIKSGKHKDMGSSYRPMTEEEKMLLQEMIDDTYKQFFNAVKAGRPNMSEESLKEYADGRVFTGERAKTLGFIDELGGEEKAKDLLGELTGLKNPKILTTKTNSFMDFLFLSSGLETKMGLAEKVEDLTSPKVSYLWTY